MSDTKRVRGLEPDQDREDTIAWEMNYCQHYTPDTIFGHGGKKATGLCAAGVSVETLPKFYKDRPCIGGHEKPNVLELCPQWLRRTREMGIERYQRAEASMRKMRLVMPAVAEWRKKAPQGKAEIISCPACSGRLHLSQARSNGHVHGRCETAGCVSWME